MKRIPDCPGGMGNANDWIKAREALGFPQNRTVSYEYTTYDYGDTDTSELVKQTHEDDEDYANDMYDMGFEHGYSAGYKQACIDIEKCLDTDLSIKAIKTTLKNTNNYNPAENRFYTITPVLEKIKESLQKGKKS